MSEVGAAKATAQRMVEWDPNTRALRPLDFHDKSIACPPNSSGLARAERPRVDLDMQIALRLGREIDFDAIDGPPACRW